VTIKAVRAAIASYLNAGVQASAIPGLNRCYRAMPVFIDPTKWWELPPDLGSGSIAFLHLARTAEKRIADPYITGQKLVDYTVALMVISRYEIPSGTQATAFEGDEWVDGLDDTLEGIKAYIRADPRLGTGPGGGGGVIFEAGQKPGDLSVTSDIPVRDEDAGEVLSFDVIDFHASENITA
jgi:hypothetical protein